MEEDAKGKERRNTGKKKTIFDRVIPKIQNDLGIAHEAANQVAVKVNEKQKAQEKRIRIKKISDVLGIIILIGLAIYMSITLMQEDFKNGAIWLVLGLSVGVLSAAMIQIFRKKKEVSDCERYNVQIVDGYASAYPDVIKQKMVKSVDEGIAWATGETNGTQSWRIMDILDGKIVKALQHDVNK